MSPLFSALTIICYVLTLWPLCRGLWQGHRPCLNRVLVFSILGGVCHLIGTLLAIFSDGQTNFSLTLSGSLIFSVTVILIALGGIRHPIHSLLLVIVPIAVIFIVTTWFGTPSKITSLPGGTAMHVVLSVLAYGIITIAACCALAMYYCNYLLKHKQLGRRIDFLPPMETIDKLLFEMILAGQVLLSLSIISGLVFVEDFLGQRLAHKTFFSLVSWTIFGTLIVGHYKFGWRGAKAIKWTLAGFIALLIAYVGSKFVIEWILGSV